RYDVCLFTDDRVGRAGAAALARRSRLRIDAISEPDNETGPLQVEACFILGRVAWVALDCAGAESTVVAAVPHRIDDAGFRLRRFQPARAGADSGAAIEMAAVEQTRT